MMLLIPLKRNRNSQLSSQQQSTSKELVMCVQLQRLANCKGASIRWQCTRPFHGHVYEHPARLYVHGINLAICETSLNVGSIYWEPAGPKRAVNIQQDGCVNHLGVVGMGHATGRLRLLSGQHAQIPFAERKTRDDFVIYQATSQRHDWYFHVTILQMSR